MIAFHQPPSYSAFRRGILKSQPSLASDKRRVVFDSPANKSRLYCLDSDSSDANCVEVYFLCFYFYFYCVKVRFISCVVGHFDVKKNVSFG